MPSGRRLNIRKLTDSTGGTASATDTLVDHTATYSQSATENNVATLRAKINQILDLLARRPG